MSWIFYAILSAIFAALVAIFGKIGIGKLDTTLATTVRSVVMAVFLVVTSLVLGKAPLMNTINSKALYYIILSGVAGALSWLFYFFALKNGPASSVAALDRTSVVFILILAVLFLGEHFTAKSAVGIGLVMVGAILIALK